MYEPGRIEDYHEIGKDTLARVADLGASRAGRLVVEIVDSIQKLNQWEKGFDNQYLKYHLKALFNEFITGEDYDLEYYDKPSAADKLNATMQDTIAHYEHDPNCECSSCKSEKLPLIQKEQKRDEDRYVDVELIIGIVAMGVIFLVMIGVACYHAYGVS